MFTLFKKFFKKQEKQVKMSVNPLLGEDFDIKVKQMLDEVLAEQKERLQKELREVLPGIKI